MGARLTPAAAAGAVLVVGAVFALLVATPAPAAATSSSCNQTVTHDAYRTADAVQTVNETGEATSTVSNTDTTVEDVTGFVRLRASNPNGYCVTYEAEISPEIVSPADLGEIEGQSGNATASWRAEQNLTSGDVYTTVTFTLGPGESELFAPSSVRVESLSWTGQAKRESQGLLSSVTSLFSNSKLEQRTYEISPGNGSSRITVPLESTDGEEIEEWQATYSVNGDTRPVSQDASAPVYYTEAESSVTFHFSEGAVSDNATVEFVAEPNPIEKLTYNGNSYASGWETIGELLPFSVAPVGVTHGGV
jgi:hypothetical protein